MKHSNQKLKFISALLLSSFSLISCVLGTVCWFRAAHDVKNDQSDLRIISPAGYLKQITVHHYLTLEEDKYVFDKNWESKIYVSSSGALVYEGATSLVLGTYTPFEKEHPALVLIELNDSIENHVDAYLSASIRTDSEYLGATKTDGTLVNKLAQWNNPMSSVIKFCGMSLSNDTELDLLYSTFEENDSIEINKNSLSDMRHFVDIASDGGSYTNYEKSKAVMEFEDNAVVKYLAFVIDYYEDSMEYIYGLNIGNPVLSNMESNVGFRCDWELVF